MKIFISHSSKDKEIIDCFVDKILILGCGLDENDIFCSSIEGLGIKTGADFRDHIKDTLQRTEYSFLLISENYKNSDICLNEMGASWAIENIRVKPFIFPEIEFDSIGTLYSVKQVAQLNKSSDLDEIFDEITRVYKTNRKISRWNKCKNDFLAFLQLFISSRNSTIVPTSFFERFVKADANINYLLMQCHPTLLDCETIFKKEYAEIYFKGYCSVFSALNKMSKDPLYPNQKYIRIKSANTYELLTNNKNFPGGMTSCAERVFNYNINFYKVEFLKNEASEHGTSYSAFCYINDKWVFLPKPWTFCPN